MNAHILLARNSAEKVSLAILICLIGLCYPCCGQSEGPPERSMLRDVLSLEDYAEVPVTWNMKGESQAFLNEGINELRDENYASAVDQLTRALEADASATVAYYFRGVARKRIFLRPEMDSERRFRKVNIRAIAEAQNDMELYLKTNPDNKEGTLELGKILVASRDSKRAAKQLTRFMDKFPDDARGPYYLGFALMDQHETAEAIRSFKQCEEVDPAFTSGLTQLGFLMMDDQKKQGEKMQIDPAKLNQAKGYFNRVLKIDSMQLTARFLRFAIAADQKRILEAMEDINFLVRYNPANWKFKLNRAYLEIDLEMYDQAFADLRPALEATHVSESNFVGKQTNADRRIDIQNAGNYLLHHVYGYPEEERTIFRKAYCLMIIGKYTEARKLLNDRRSLQKESCTHFLIGVCFEHEQLYLEARGEYLLALEIDPDIFDANKKCGIIYTSEGKWKESLPYFLILEKLNPTYNQTYNLRGVVYYNLRNFPKAIDDFSKFLDQDTTNKEVFYNRAMSYKKMGNDLMYLTDLVHSMNFSEINMRQLMEVLDLHIQKGDTAILKDYAAQLIKVPSRWGLGIDLEIMKVKLMQLERNWLFINDRYNRLVLKKNYGDNPTYISFTMSAKASQYLEVDDLDEAIDLLNKSLKYDNKNWLAYHERGIARLRRNELEKALSDFELAAGLGDQRAAAMVRRLVKK